jgi:sll1239 protein
MSNSKKKLDNCFDEFNDILPKRKEPSIQALYDYEKHYMELVRKYSKEINMIAEMLSDFRDEQKEFYEEILPQVSEKLNQEEIIDNEMKKRWLTQFKANMDRSFSLTETLINNYTTKKIDEFKTIINEKIMRL